MEFEESTKKFITTLDIRQISMIVVKANNLIFIFKKLFFLLDFRLFWVSKNFLNITFFILKIEIMKNIIHELII